MLKKLFMVLFTLAIMLALPSCQRHKTAQQTPAYTIFVAKSQTIPTQLFYGGVVSPLQIYNVNSPADGVINVLNFKYGQIVQKGEVLLTMNSTKLRDDYRQALTDYFKASEDFNNAKSNFAGSTALYKATIISQQDYLNDKAQYDSTVLAYLNAKHALSELVKKIPGNETLNVEKTIGQVNLDKISLGDINAVGKALHLHTSDIAVTTNQTGVVLSPQKNTGDGDDNSNKPLSVGSQVKEGQTLVTVGDLSGITTTVQVSEMVINQIKPGQNVIVSIEALPNLNLKGVVKTVAAQAQAADQGQSGVAMFPVSVGVANLTAAQQQLIRVGMTTKIQINIQNPPQIMVPINAVVQKNGVNVVTVQDAQGKSHDVAVVTGQTTLDQVAITAGIKEGDKIRVPSASPTMPITSQ